MDKERLAEIQAALEEIGAEPCEGSALLLKRSLSAAGTNRQFINGSPVPLQGLKSVGDLLVDVHRVQQCGVHRAAHASHTVAAATNPAGFNRSIVLKASR